jgi:hypothetical protein
MTPISRINVLDMEMVYFDVLLSRLHDRKLMRVRLMRGSRKFGN